MSDTPILSALSRYAERKTLRMHMPGHKGQGLFPLDWLLDATELADTGCLYDDAPPFSDANRLAARAWGVPQAMILAGGATLGIQAMLRYAFGGTENRRLLVDRGSHKSVYHAMAINDLYPTYLSPDCKGRAPFEQIGATFSLELLERTLTETAPRAVILTSPTYYGTMHDIAAIAKVVHAHNALLCVDEAHGAHLPFCAGFSPAVALGADMAVCSLHKTLSALTGAALLTFADWIDRAELSRAAATFGSSSPSFLIAASADAARNDAEASAAVFSARVQALKALRVSLAERGLAALGADDCASHLADPLRLTVCSTSVGISGSDAAERLNQAGIVAEMSDADHVVCIVTAADSESDLARIQDAFSALIPEIPRPTLSAPMPIPKIACSPREAWMAASETIATSASLGRISAETVGRYPPGIPIVAPGEIITEKVAAAFAADPSAYPAEIRVLRQNG